MATASGIALEQNLHGFHLGEVGRIVCRVMLEHEGDGCHFAEGAYDRVMASALTALRAHLAERLEAEEVACPRRGIAIAAAA